MLPEHRRRPQRILEHLRPDSLFLERLNIDTAILLPRVLGKMTAAVTLHPHNFDEGDAGDPHISGVIDPFLHF